MVKSVNGVIVIDGCNDPNCGNNRHPNNKGTATATATATTSTTATATTSTTTRLIKSDEDPIEELTTSPFLFDDDPDDGSSSSSSDKERESPIREPDYQFAQKIIDNFQYFMMESVKDCFQNLIHLMKTFQFACVYHDILTFFYSAEELLSLDS